MVALVGSALAVGGCDCRQSEATKSEAGMANPPEPVQSAAVLVFPDELRVGDATVNAFVDHAMTVCSNRDYQAFRLLWSAREDPLTRDEFEEGWHAVKEIRVRGLERVKLAPAPDQGEGPPQMVYALFAEVGLDPTHQAAQQKARREVVLMIVREHDVWRLAKAPKRMRAWMTDKVEESGLGTQSQGTPRPMHDG